MLALIVDDSRAMRTIVSNIVEEIGYETIQAADGVDALKQLNSGTTPELMLVDWNMPNMNGLELVAEARALPQLALTTIVMATTESGDSHVKAALAAGANEYVVKPFTKEILSQKLKAIHASEIGASPRNNA